MSSTATTDNTLDNNNTNNNNYNNNNNDYNNITINKPPTDQKSYKFLKLQKNQLEILLISDPQTQQSSAAMDIKVGHFSDHLPGIAHFCEHMCFLGSKKFPKEGEYQEFIKMNGGMTNAFTGAENTNYHFSVANNKLEEALDRFAQFFICPLFTESATFREINAVNSEHLKNRQEDIWREFQLFKSTANEKHPFSKFGTGNLKTLQEIPEMEGKSIRNILLNFYNQFYSANQMKLCILGNLPILELERIAIEKFSDIPNKGIVTNDFYPTPEVKVYNESDLQKFYKVKTVSNLRDLILLFPITVHTKLGNIFGRSELYKIKPERYISHLLGHESEGSLCSFLKSKGWINGLSAGPISKFSGCQHYNNIPVDKVTVDNIPVDNTCDKMEVQTILFNLTMELTIEGESHYQEIIKYIFEYIDLLKNPKNSNTTTDKVTVDKVTDKVTVDNNNTKNSKNIIQKWVWNEMQFTSKLSFENLEMPRPLQLTTDMASNLQKYNPQDVISGSYLFEQFDENIILEMLNQLNVNNFNIYLMKQDWNDVTNVTTDNTVDNIPVDNVTSENVTSNVTKNLWKEEKWYGTQYSVENLTFEFLEELKNIKHTTIELNFPKQNPFIPEDLSIRCLQKQKQQSSEPQELVNTDMDTTNLVNTEENNNTIVKEEEEEKGPEKIEDWTDNEESKSRINFYFKQDSHFKTPRLSVFYHFTFPETYASPNTVVMIRLFTKLIDDYLNEQVYAAELAGLKYDLSVNTNGLTLLIIGYNDKLNLLNDLILKTMVKAALNGNFFNEERFHLVKESLQRTYFNFKFNQPYEHALVSTLQCLYKVKYTSLEYFDVIGEITFMEMCNFIYRWFKFMKFDILIHGNYTKEEATKLVKDSEKILFEDLQNLQKNYKIKVPKEEFNENILQLPLQKDVILPIKEYNLQNENNALEITYQISKRNLKIECIAELFLQLISTAYYTKLRTEEQLGYIVHSRLRNDHNILNISLIVQSNRFNPLICLGHSDYFIEKLLFKQVLENLNEDVLQSNISAIISKTLEKEKQMKMETVRHWSEIITKQFKFNRRFEKVKFFKEITKQDLIDFYFKYFTLNGNTTLNSDNSTTKNGNTNNESEYKRLIVMFYANKFEEEMKEFLETNKITNEMLGLDKLNKEDQLNDEKVIENKEEEKNEKKVEKEEGDNKEDEVKYERVEREIIVVKDLYQFKKTLPLYPSFHQY
ncbi:hypothetical protein ABK040_011425 [Willaertia magna]